jgi:hypothetical protein
MMPSMNDGRRTAFLLTLYILVATSLIVAWELFSERTPVSVSNLNIPHLASSPPPPPPPRERARHREPPPTVDPPVHAAATPVISAVAVEPPADMSTYLPASLMTKHVKHANNVKAFLSNMSASPLAVDVQIVNSATQAVTSQRLELQPYETKTFGDQDGILLNSGDRVTLRSPPFRDRTEIVQ